MKRIIYILVIINWSNLLLSQERETISFDFSYGLNGYKMEHLNEFYIDSLASTPENDIFRDYVKKGQYFKLSVNYKPISWLEVGGYGSYQFSRLKSYHWEKHFGEDVKNLSILRTEALSFGVGSTFYFSNLFRNKEKFNRLHIGVELNGGLSFLSIININIIPAEFNSQKKQKYTPKNQFQGQAGIKIEYDFTQTPIFTTLGLRAGYQFLKSGTVRDAAGQEWLINDKYPINLDFSGFYFGVYLKIGK